MSGEGAMRDDNGTQQEGAGGGGDRRAVREEPDTSFGLK